MLSAQFTFYTMEIYSVKHTSLSIFKLIKLNCYEITKDQSIHKKTASPISDDFSDLDVQTVLSLVITNIDS